MSRGKWTHRLVGTSGRRFAWDRLQEASWTPVEPVDATIDGAPTEKPKLSRPAPAKPVIKARISKAPTTHARPGSAAGDPAGSRDGAR